MAIAMNDSRSSVTEYATIDEPSTSDSDELIENGDTAPLTPQSDAQKLAALVRLKMVADELLQDRLSSYSESSHGGHGQSSLTSPRESIMHPSDLIHIDSILTQDEALEVKAMARLRKRPALGSRMRKEHFQFASEDGGKTVGMLRVETHQHSDCKHMAGRM